MKIAAGKAEGFVTKPDAHVWAVLVYGPDRGLVRERADRLVTAWGVDSSDPFALTVLSEEAIKADPPKLEDEARALSLTAAARAVRARVSGDGAAGPITTFVEALDAQAYEPAARVVFEAGALTTRSKLRKAFEGAKLSAALPCYADGPGDLEPLIEAHLAQEGVVLTEGARALLPGRLEGDRALARAELTKLALYAYGRSDPITEGEVATLISGAEPGDVNAVTEAVLDGDAARADAAYARALAAGASPVGVALALQRGVMRLDAVRTAIDNGAAADQAMNAARPPVFGPARVRMKSQLRAWTRPKIDAALGALVSGERALKTTGSADTSLCGRLVLSLARSAQRVRSPN